MPHEIKNILDTIVIIFGFLGVSTLLLGFLTSVVLYRVNFHKKNKEERVSEFKMHVGRTILIGLEILVAATVVKTVAVDLTFESTGMLAGIIFVRTMITWTISTEINGYWPWAKKPGKNTSPKS